MSNTFEAIKNWYFDTFIAPWLTPILEATLGPLVQQVVEGVTVALAQGFIDAGAEATKGVVEEMVS